MGLILRHLAGRRKPQAFQDARGWVDREIAGCEFRDARLDDRFRKLLAQLGGALGQSIPLVCQDWANTKAAYRFSSNDRVSEAAKLTSWAVIFNRLVIAAPPLTAS
jgi:Transposase DNA-binding